MSQLNRAKGKGRLYEYIKGGGEMSELISNHDWSATSLGPISDWPESLFINLGNVLHSSFPMFLFWGSDLISFYNDAYRPSLGNNGKHPAIGRKGKEVWSEVWEFVRPLIDQVLKTGKAAWFENQLVPIFRNNQIEDVYWTFSHSPAFGEGGKICGVIVTCIETTKNVLDRQIIDTEIADRTNELERAQSSLIQANVYLQQIINLFKEPLQVLEPVFQDGKIIDFKFKLTNAAYATYAKTTPEQLMGKRVGDVFPGYFGTTSFDKPIETFQTGIPDTWEIHYNMDGLDLYNKMSSTKLGEEVVLHFTDYTQLKYLELELLEKIKQLEHSNRNLEDFGQAVSHDLKAPLRKIQVFISKFLEESDLSSEDLRPLIKIQSAAENMNGLIDDLIAFTRVNEGHQQKKLVDLNHLIQRVLEDLELDIHQKNALITLENLPSVNGYSRQLQQMMQNLLTNALKYSKADVAPEIVVRASVVTENQRNYNSIEVNDNGIGFDPKFAKDIFKMFSRLHSSSKYDGNGIGLSIVKKVVENHNGTVTAQSTPGVGSIFIVLLPID